MNIETRTCLVADEKSLILFSLAMAVVLLVGCGRKQQEPSPAQVSVGGQTNALVNNQPSSRENKAPVFAAASAFGDGMVLQRDKPVVIWADALPNELPELDSQPVIRYGT